MSLTELIDKHRKDLSLPVRMDWSDESSFYKHKPFCDELLNLPSFTYSPDHIEIAAAHLRDIGFDQKTQDVVTQYAIRRLALESITDTSARKEIWRLMDFMGIIYQCHIEWGSKEGFGHRSIGKLLGFRSKKSKYRNAVKKFVEAREVYIQKFGEESERHLLVANESFHKLYYNPEGTIRTDIKTNEVYRKNLLWEVFFSDELIQYFRTASKHYILKSWS